MTVYFSETPGDGAIAGGLTGGRAAQIRFSFGNRPPFGRGVVPEYIELTPVQLETSAGDDSPIRISVAEIEYVIKGLRERQTDPV